MLKNYHAIPKQLLVALCLLPLMGVKQRGMFDFLQLPKEGHKESEAIVFLMGVKCKKKTRTKTPNPQTPRKLM